MIGEIAGLVNLSVIRYVVERTVRVLQVRELAHGIVGLARVGDRGAWDMVAHVKKKGSRYEGLASL